MRIRLFAKTLLAVLFCSSTFAAMDADRGWANEHRMAFSVDPLTWTNGNLRFQYEVSINDRLAINVPVHIGFDKVIFANSYNGTQFVPKVGVKYYVTGKATHQGFYVNPLLGIYFQKLNNVVGAAAADTNAGLAYGFRFGYAWNIWHGLWLDSYFGYEAMATSFNSDTNSNAGGAGTKIPGNLQIESNGFAANGAGGFNASIMLGYNW